MFAVVRAHISIMTFKSMKFVNNPYSFLNVVFPFIFSPSKVSQLLLQPCKTDFVSCDENVMRDCQKFQDMLLLLYPQVCYPIVFFSIFLGKIHWPLFFGSSSNLFLKTRMMFFFLVFLICTSLIPCPLKGYCWCSGMNSVRLQWNAES